MDGDGGEGGKKPLFSLSISPPRPPLLLHSMYRRRGKGTVGERERLERRGTPNPPSLSLLPPSKRGKESHHHYRHCDRGEEKGGGRREKGGLLFPFPSARRHTHKESDERRRRRRILAAAVASPPSFPPLPPLLIFPPPSLSPFPTGGKECCAECQTLHCTIGCPLHFEGISSFFPAYTVIPVISAAAAI